MRVLGNFAQIHVRRERHRARVNSEDLQPRLLVGNSDFNFAIEAAGTPQRRIENFGNIRRADHDDLTARDKTIHQAEKLRDDALLDFAGDFGALGSDRVNLVDEQNRGSMTRRFLEHLAQLGFALAVKLAHDLGAVEVNEVNAAFGSDGARQQSLARARRTIQQHALGRENSQPLEDARIFQRQFDNFANARHFALQAANIFIGDRGRARRGLLAFDDANVGALADDHRTRRDRAHHLEVHGLGKRRHAHDRACHDRNADQIFEHAIGRDGRGRGADPQRRKADGDGILVLDHGDRDLLLQSCTAVAAAGAVDLDHAFVSVVGKFRASHADRRAGDLQHVADVRANAPQIDRRQSRDGVAHILDARFCNAQGKGRGRRLVDFGHRKLREVFLIVVRSDGQTCDVVSPFSQFHDPQIKTSR